LAQKLKTGSRLWFMDYGTVTKARKAQKIKIDKPASWIFRYSRGAQRCSGNAGITPLRFYSVTHPVIHSKNRSSLIIQLHREFGRPL